MRTSKAALLALLLIPVLTLSHCGQKGGLTRPEAPPPPTTSQYLAPLPSVDFADAYGLPAATLPPLPLVNPIDTYRPALATFQNLATPPVTSQHLALFPFVGLANAYRPAPAISHDLAGSPIQPERQQAGLAVPPR